MKRPPKDHKRLIADAATLLGSTYFTVFFQALGYDRPKEEQRICTDEATVLLDQFSDRGYTTEQVENFCIDILTGRLPVFSQKGKIINPRKHGKPG